MVEKAEEWLVSWGWTSSAAAGGRRRRWLRRNRNDWSAVVVRAQLELMTGRGDD